MSDSITASLEYNELPDSIKRTLAAGQLRAARAVNNVLVETYWQIGGAQYQVRLGIGARFVYERWRVHTVTYPRQCSQSFGLTAADRRQSFGLTATEA